MTRPIRSEPPADALWRVPFCGGGPTPIAWEPLLPLPPFTLASGEGPAHRQTEVKLAWNAHGLHVRIACDDPDPWGTWTARDSPLWQEEVVEIFIAPGCDVPSVYREVEFNPLGAVFDAVVRNPDGRRETMTVDATWDWPGLAWKTVVTPGCWIVSASLPWSGLDLDRPPRHCRANLCRVERPRDREPEYSCWRPTRTQPADFHKPERFGFLIFEV